MSACLFVTFVLIFHVGLKFIFCRRWQVVYVFINSVKIYFLLLQNLGTEPFNM